MKLFHLSLASAFKSTSSDYITKEAVQRANAKLIGDIDALRQLSLEDVYTRYDVTPPTREQFMKVGKVVMDELTP